MRMLLVRKVMPIAALILINERHCGCFILFDVHDRLLFVSKKSVLSFDAKTILDDVSFRVEVRVPSR